MRRKLIAFIFLNMLLFNMILSTIDMEQFNADTSYGMSDGMNESDYPDFSSEFPSTFEEGDPLYPSDYDIGNILADNDNEYNEIYEPWKSEAAIHAIKYDESTGFLALGGGYLYDNEVHIYRLNTETGKFDKVWDSGDNIIQSDVVCLDIGDTDLNDFIEIVAGSADGHVYVFEQRHIYDPTTNTENMFDLVWTSPSMFRVLDVKIEDTDLDYRPDIIVGSWNGLYMYEYVDHSGYPFDDEHWIEYEQVWESGDLEGKKIYSIEAGDTNQNGLPDIIAGTRDGTVYVFENDGITVWINDEPFPLIQDNEYALNWTSGEYSWKPIISMDIGEIDGTSGEEIALIAQGQGLFVLDWNTSENTYNYRKVVKDFQDWETYGYWGLDVYADSVVSAENVTYHDNVNLTLIVEEPIDYVWNGTAFEPDTEVYPYNTAMAGEPDMNYTTFDASGSAVNQAYAIIDFGLDEEGTGSANSNEDISIQFNESLSTTLYDEVNISISRDGSDFEQIENANMILNGNYLEIDVDDALIERHWDYFRYVKISVYNDGVYEISSLTLSQPYNLLTDALSLTIGPLRMDGDKFLDDETEEDKIIMGTVSGKYIAVGWNETIGDYDVIWDSAEDDFYSAETGIWDIESIATTTDIPIWRYIDPSAQRPFYPPKLNPGTDEEFNSWTYSKLNYYTNPSIQATDSYYFMGSKNSSILTYDQNGQINSEVTSYLDTINFYLQSVVTNRQLISVAVPDLKVSNFSYICPIAVGSYDPDLVPLGNPLDTPAATIDFWYRDSFNLTSEFTEHKSIQSFDKTGEITSLLAVSTTTPKMDFADIDGDGDLDMVFTNGELHLAMNLAESIGSGFYTDLSFVLQRDYFKQINDALTSDGWGQPDLWDLDGDGDLDVVLSYANKAGATAFINKGTAEDPDWVQDKSIFSNSRPETNMKYNNFGDTRIIPNNMDSSLDMYSQAYGYDIEDYSVVSYSPDTNYTYWFEPVYDAIDSYLVATYPEVIRTEFSLLTASNDDFMNFGFHVRESWSTEDDLLEWTLCISSGDIDGDGNGEIVVGDYDNNVYVFENLVNNTYKRMDSTFDLHHNETSDESPYLYEELQGISGEFTRVVWDHAKHLLVGVDLDQDGLKELIVSSDLQAFIFEDLGLSGGDEFEYQYMISLRDSEYENLAGWENVEEITALAAGNDIDLDGNYELLIAAGPYLHVYNVPNGTFDGTADNDIFVTGSEFQGRYDLLGNPLYNDDYENATISALAVADTDQDGNKEIILGGTYNSYLMRVKGFTYIYESQGGTFSKVWELPSSHTQNNPVNVITIDDQDYDGSEEIIIGHSFGIDIWEWIPGTDSQYNLMEYITSNPNYPVIDLDESLGRYAITGERTYNTMATNENTGDVMHIFTARDGTGEFLFYRTYIASSKTWTAASRLYSGVYYSLSGHSLRGEIEPSVTCMEDGTFYVIWKTRDNYNDNALYMSRFMTGSWVAPVMVRNLINGEYRSYPDIFELSATEFGITYVYDSDRIAFGHSGKVGFSAPSSWPTLMFENWDDYNIHSASVTRLPNGEFAVGMSAINVDIAKPDYDLYVLYLNSSFAYSGISPYHATTSYADEFLPDISYIHTDGEDSLVMVYEKGDSTFEERIGIIASKDNAKTWGNENTLNVIPPSVSYVENTELNYLDWYYYEGIPYYLSGPMVVSPCIAPLQDEGFMYMYSMTAESIPFDYLEYWWFKTISGVNNQSDWIDNSIGEVIDLDIGDTDSDGRNEIVAGWDSYVGVYELNSSLDHEGMMAYKEAWLSDEFENQFTGVTVYDSNGNGWDEIGISTKKGDVVLLENRDPSVGATNLISSNILQNITISSESDDENFVSYDLDGDLLDEVIIGFTAGGSTRVMALDDDNTVLWENTDAIGICYYMELKDVSGDGLPEVIVSTSSQYVVVINITTGVQLWNYQTSPLQYLYHVDTGDLDNDGDLEMVVGVHNGSILILNHDGSYHSQMNLPAASSIYSLSLGNYTGGDKLSVAYIDSNDQLQVYYPLNATLIYTSPAGTAESSDSDIVAYDLDEDGIDEIIFGDEYLRILDAVDAEIYYNSTEYGTLTRELFVEDFDGDGKIEILIQTDSNELYLEDITTGQTQWSYSPSIGDINSVKTGYFGGNGAIDICIGSQNGIVVALDGQNGIPLWFHNATVPIFAVDAVNITGESSMKIAAFTDSLSGVVIYQGNPYSEFSEIPIHEIKSSYMSWGFSENSIIDYWVEDVDADGFQDILLQTDDFDFYLINLVSESLVWERPIGLKGHIELLTVGNLNAEGDLDIAIYSEEDGINTFEGRNGEYMEKIPITEDHKPEFMEINDFTDYYEDGGSFYELVVMYSKIDPVPTPNHFLSWFDNKGNVLFSSEYNQTETVTSVVTGNLLNQGDVDIAVAGETFNVEIFNGDDGKRADAYNPGLAIERMTTGDILGTGSENIVMELSDSSIEILYFDSGIIKVHDQLSFSQDSIRGFKTADIYDAGMDQLFVDVIGEGIHAYDRNGYLSINYDLMQTVIMQEGNCSMLFGNFDRKNEGNIIVTNLDYIYSIRQNDGSIEWQHNAEGTILNPQLAVFRVSKYQDLVYVNGSHIVFVCTGDKFDTINPPISNGLEFVGGVELWKFTSILGTVAIVNSLNKRQITKLN